MKLFESECQESKPNGSLNGTTMLHIIAPLLWREVPFNESIAWEALNL
jgi:hypothetical protein